MVLHKVCRGLDIEILNIVFNRLFAVSGASDKGAEKQIGKAHKLTGKRLGAFKHLLQISEEFLPALVRDRVVNRRSLAQARLVQIFFGLHPVKLDPHIFPGMFPVRVIVDQLVGFNKEGLSLMELVLIVAAAQAGAVGACAGEDAVDQIVAPHAGTESMVRPGIPYPDETWTWQDMADAAQKLTDKEKGQYGFASPAANNQDGYYNLIYAMGGSVISDDKTVSGWDSDETIKAMNWWKDNLVEVSMPAQEIMAESPADVLLGSGKAAMIMQGSWMVAAFKENEYIDANCDVAVLPKAEDGTRKTIYNGLGWAAAAEGAHTEEAWKLLEYLGSEEAQKKQARLGVTMSAFMGTSDTWVNCAPEFNLKAYLDMTADMEIRPYSRNTKVWEDYSQSTMVRAYTGEMTMEEVCRDIAAFMNGELEEEKQ